MKCFVKSKKPFLSSIVPTSEEGKIIKYDKAKNYLTSHRISELDVVEIKKYCFIIYAFFHFKTGFPKGKKNKLFVYFFFFLLTDIFSKNAPILIFFFLSLEISQLHCDPVQKLFLIRRW